MGRIEETPADSIPRTQKSGQCLGHSMSPTLTARGSGSLWSGGSCQGLKKIAPECQGSLLPRGLSQGLVLAPPALLTSEAQLTVTNPTVLCRALLLLLAAAPAPLDTLIELSPAVPSRVLLQALLLGPSVLKPNLPHKTHIQRMPTPQPPGGWRQGLEFKARSTMCPGLPQPQKSPTWQIPQDHGPKPPRGSVTWYVYHSHVEDTDWPWAPEPKAENEDLAR